MLAGVPCFPPGWPWRPALQHSVCERQERWQWGHGASWRSGFLLVHTHEVWQAVLPTVPGSIFFPKCVVCEGSISEHRARPPPGNLKISVPPVPADISFNGQTRGVGRYGLLWMAQQHLETFFFMGRMSLSCLYSWFSGTFDLRFALLLFRRVYIGREQ